MQQHSTKLCKELQQTNSKPLSPPPPPPQKQQQQDSRP
jgi:hypothetical protein